MPSGIISKQSIIDEFTTNVTNKLAYKYHSSNLPARPSAYDQGSANAADYSSSVPTLKAANISGSIATASTFLTDITNFIKNSYSCIRNIEIICRNRGDNDNIQSTEISKALLANAYAQNLSTIDLYATKETVISTPFWNNAYQAWLQASENKALTITYTKHVRYSRHGSRIRR